jgi:hypothetical protein
MADGVGITEGSGKVVATDEKNFGAGVVHVQYVALADARNGNTNLVNADAFGNLMIMVSGLKSAIKTTVLDLAQAAAAVKTVTTPLAGRSTIVVYNESDVTVRLGPSGVAATGATRGLPLLSGQSVSLDIGEIDLYAYAPTGGAAGVKTLTIFEVA